MEKIAVLYQAHLPPLIDGIRKPMKPGGYSDSGADIAFALMKHGRAIVTPVSQPDNENDLEWVFPDTKQGIQHAFDQGANVIWLNTVLYKNHPVEHCFRSDISFVGQLPSKVDMYDDKLFTNKLLKDNGISIPKSVIISKEHLTSLSLDVDFPLVVKPIRGRGSQGVSLVKNQKELVAKIKELFSSQAFGAYMYAEQFLSGQEITITVMPAGNYKFNHQSKFFEKPWCLPAVKRFNHDNGIAPYNGVVAVMENSAILDKGEQASAQIAEINRQCEKAAELIGIKAPIRIDCRADEAGKYYLFDLNMKPNMTGPSRPQRQNQDSLTLMAAKGIHWDYIDLLDNMIAQKWKAIY